MSGGEGTAWLDRLVIDDDEERKQIVLAQDYLNQGNIALIL